MHTWINNLRDVIASGETACLVTVVNIRGSAPREAGARMLVTATQTFGTVGGGELEYQCTKLAVERIRAATDNHAGHVLRTFPLGSNCGQCCGGVVDVLIEYIADASLDWVHELKRLYDQQKDFVTVSSAHEGRGLIVGGRLVNFGLPEQHVASITATAAAMCEAGEHVCWTRLNGDKLFCERIAVSDFNIAIFGAGHVGSAVVAVLSSLDCRIRWIDSRRNVLPVQVADNIATIESVTPAREVAAIPSGSYFLIMTHSHALDLEIIDQVLRRQDARYCGLIGSQSKRRRFERLLRKQGMTDEVLADLVCPIGVAGIPGKRPQEIAVAVAAELLQMRAASAKTADQDRSDNVHAI